MELIDIKKYKIGIERIEYQINIDIPNNFDEKNNVLKIKHLNKDCENKFNINLLFNINSNYKHNTDIYFNIKYLKFIDWLPRIIIEYNIINLKYDIDFKTNIDKYYQRKDSSPIIIKFKGDVDEYYFNIRYKKISSKVHTIICPIICNKYINATYTVKIRAINIIENYYKNKLILLIIL